MAYERNPILSFFYFVLILGAYFTFMLFVRPSLAAKDPEIITASQLAQFSALIVVALLSWAAVRYADPGTVRQSNWPQHFYAFEHDHMVHTERFCAACQVSVWCCGEFGMGGRRQSHSRRTPWQCMANHHSFLTERTSTTNSGRVDSETFTVFFETKM